MITAAQAREQTIGKLQQVAKEFIINDVNPAIDEAIRSGRFYADLCFKRVPNPEVTGGIVVKLLKEQGYDAEHVYYDGSNGYGNHILIKWEEV